MNILEILKKYDNFSDALIESVCYYPNDGIKPIKGRLLVVLQASNTEKNYHKERIGLEFTGITQLRLMKVFDYNNSVVFEAFGLDKNGTSIIDFFPIDNGVSLEENPHSSLSASFVNVSYIE